MARVAAIAVPKRFWGAAAGLICLSLAQFILTSCEPDEYVPAGGFAVQVHPR